MKQELTMTQEWDKVFPLSKEVNHLKVTFETQYGLTLAADLYTPRNAEGKLPAIAVSGNDYNDAFDDEQWRHRNRENLSNQRLADPRAMAGGVLDTVPPQAPRFVHDYYDYYKTERGYHQRFGNSNDGWRIIGTQAYANSRFLYYINEIRSAVLIMHGADAHSRYFGEAAFHYMTRGKAEGYKFVGEPKPNPENKQLLIIPDASHCDLYDGGYEESRGKGQPKNMIPWDKLAAFFQEHLI